MKIKRQVAIEEIIAQKDICTQEALQEELKALGFDVTQATCSRDIKSMGLIKVISKDGKYCYAKNAELLKKNKPGKFHSVFLEAVISLDYAQNIVAVKCHVGMGNAACAAIDMMDLGDIVGTLAGDDTIFILLRSVSEAKELVDKINEILGR